jgi:hypothetical protein
MVELSYILELEHRLDIANGHLRKMIEFAEGVAMSEGTLFGHDTDVEAVQKFLDEESGRHPRPRPTP